MRNESRFIYLYNDPSSRYFTYLFLSFWSHQVIWGLNSPTRDQTHAPALGVWSPNHWTTREFPFQVFLNNTFQIESLSVMTSLFHSLLPRCSQYQDPAFTNFNINMSIKLRTKFMFLKSIHLDICWSSLNFLTTM